jgi:enoyl-CoA hydratase/carnithine racemase
MTETVISKCDNGTRNIILNRPERLNAINPELLKDFLIALREGNADPETKVMVISGAGRAFCAGDDLKEFDDQAGTEEETRAYIESIQDITREIVLGDKIVLGAIHGWAVGGGLEWVINCDFAIMAEGTRSFFPEISLGIFVTGAVTTILPKLVGLQKAKELILLGERFDAAQALNWGLVWKVVPEADLMNETMAIAERIADLPELAVRDLKRVINRACDLDVEAAMKLETDATVRGFLDPETAQRISGFSK